ncbi:RidA family protein [Candidatus Riflebacteria bacterium]
MKPIIAANAPEAIGPYSHAIKSSVGMVFLSGQIGIDPKTGEMKNKTLSEEVHQVFSNIKAVLEAGDLTLKNVVKSTVYLKDMNEFPEVNKIYAGYFTDHLPARACVEVSRLPKDARVEIEVIAVE